MKEEEPTISKGNEGILTAISQHNVIEGEDYIRNIQTDRDKGYGIQQDIEFGISFEPNCWTTSPELIENTNIRVRHLLH